MKIRRYIFGSKSEYDLFRALQNRWSNIFDLWPSLPFSTIVALDRAEPSLSNKEREFFYNTNIDYTLCTKNGSPILSIEFDGLGKGFSRNGEYIQIEKSIDPYRKLKLDLKIKIANKLEYPFFVISFEESNELSSDLNLTIVDGIIGQALANKKFKETIRTLYYENQEMIDSLPDYAKNEYIQDLVIEAEVTTELQMDPIAKLAAEYEIEAMKGGAHGAYSMEYLYDPPLPKGDPFHDISILEKRINAFNSVVRVGCKIIVNTTPISIIQTAWVRNFGDTFISPLKIAENIAMMLAFKKAVDPKRES